MALFFLLFVGRSFPWDPVIDKYDLVEVNHCYHYYGAFRYDQLVFWNWSKFHGEYRVQARLVMKNSRSFDDKEHQKEWERDKDDLFPPNGNLQDLRKCIYYPGKYVGGPNVPRRSWRGEGKYVVEYRNKKGSRRIEMKFLRETITYFDPNKQEKLKYPWQFRKKLTKFPEPKANVCPGCGFELCEDGEDCGCRCD